MGIYRPGEIANEAVYRSIIFSPNQVPAFYVEQDSEAQLLDVKGLTSFCHSVKN